MEIRGTVQQPVQAAEALFDAPGETGMVVGRCALQVERIVHRLRQPFVALGDGVVDAVQLRHLAAEQDDGGACARAGDRRRAPEAAMRSEEHTSELQSLMRSSYAVFCSKKKNTQQ